MKRKLVSYPAEQKQGAPTVATTTRDAGLAEAFVSVFGNVDYQGDRVVKGAFSKSLQEWRQSGDPLPVIWSHDWSDPFSHVGKVLAAEETDRGLLVRAKFDLDNPRGAHVFKLLKERRVTEWSFAYDVVRETKTSDGATDLLELRLIEVGPTLKGANPLTTTLSVKSATKFLGLERANKQIDAVLAGIPNRSRTGVVRDVDRYLTELRAEIAADRKREAARAKTRARMDEQARAIAASARTRVRVDARFRVTEEEEVPRSHEEVADAGANYVFMHGHLEKLR